MSLKHNFSVMFAQDNPLVGIIAEVNEATGMLVYFMLLLVFIVSAYIMVRRTQDMAKSLISSLHIVVILSFLVYYAGKMIGYVFVDDIVMLGIVVLEIFALTGTYFMRSKNI